MTERERPPREDKSTKNTYSGERSPLQRRRSQQTIYGEKKQAIPRDKSDNVPDGSNIKTPGGDYGNAAKARDIASCMMSATQTDQGGEIKAQTKMGGRGLQVIEDPTLLSQHVVTVDKVTWDPLKQRKVTKIERNKEEAKARARLGEEVYMDSDMDAALFIKRKAGQRYAMELRKGREQFYALGNTRGTQTIVADVADNWYYLIEGTRKIGPYTQEGLLDMYVSEMIHDRTLLYSDALEQRLQLIDIPEIRRLLCPEGGYYIRTLEMIERALNGEENITPDGPFTALNLRDLYYEMKIDETTTVAAPNWKEWIAIEALPELKRIITQPRAMVEGIKAAVKLQSLFRSFKARQQLKLQKLKKYCAIKIQATWRMYVCKYTFQRERFIIIFAQRVYRVSKARNSYMKTFGVGRRRIIIVQGSVRASLARIKFLRIRRRFTQFQSWLRCYFTYRWFQRCRKAAVLVQSTWRMFITRRHFKFVIRSVNEISKVIRSKVAGNEYQRIRYRIIRLQAAWRGFVNWRWFKGERQKIIKLQSLWRMHVQRWNYLYIVDQIMCLQQAFRMLMQRKRFLHVRKSIVRIQAFCRRSLIKTQWTSIFPLLLAASITIQKNWRRYLAQKKLEFLRNSRRKFVSQIHRVPVHDFMEFTPHWIAMQKGQICASMPKPKAIYNKPRGQLTRGQSIPRLLKPLNDADKVKRLQRAMKTSRSDDDSIMSDRSHSENGDVTAAPAFARKKVNLHSKHQVPQLRGETLWINRSSELIDEDALSWGAVFKEGEPVFMKGLPFQNLLAYLINTKPENISYREK